MNRSMIGIALLLWLSASPGYADPSQADRAWASRGEELGEDLALPGRIESAIEGYRTALEADAQSLELRWKLLRALQYAVEFTRLEEAEKDAYVAEAVGLARTSETLLDSNSGRAVDPNPRSAGDRARLLFWSSIAWGMHAQRVGLLTVVREGVASRMREGAERSLDLDPSVEGGGALRLLSRLHATLPRVPFVSSWVDRDRAVPLAEGALAVDAEHPGNRLVLALALLEQVPEREEEARNLLRDVAAADPRPEFRVEDLAIRRQAREKLDAARN